ncbi:MAG TPA: GMC family oxidoreductase [Candidatus Bathyarchaeia archaeon]|nr:GMC family oxidoreductase [Candidatus Bathyarchaeia archaeon]
MASEHDFDVVVIGSGFGGSVTACRLAEAGNSVLVLERGHRWGPMRGHRDERSERGEGPDGDVMPFPREADDLWLWDQLHPEQSHGFIDYRAFPHMGVIQSSGVGGGSLIYANVLIEADPSSFEAGWPPEITWDRLRPYYQMVDRMLEPRTVPPAQWSERVKLLKEAADRNGWSDRFQLVEVAVRFDDQLVYESSKRPDPGVSRRYRNRHGAWQGTCAHLGNCDLGCEVGARNTLDKNYLYIAEQRGAQVWPLHLVRSIAPDGRGYRVRFDRIADGRFHPGDVSSRLVIVAAGSLGSTELLLRCKEQYRTLPALSPFLGQNWSSNGDFLTPAFHFFRKTVYPGRGLAFGGHVQFLHEPSADPTAPAPKPQFNIEDGGFPYQATRALVRHLAKARSTRKGLSAWLFRLVVRSLGAVYGLFHWLARLPMLRSLRGLVERLDPTNYMMPWIAQGMDGADGTLNLKDGELMLDWRPEHGATVSVIDKIYETHRKLARATRGFPLPAIAWKLFRFLVTPHPLGGCKMGPDAARGVVDHKGEVFGYPGLYVADGAIVPQALGVNPAKTIAALAERIAEHIVRAHPRPAL